LQYHKQAQEHPELKKDALSRFRQKQRIKKQYQKRAREAAKKSAKTAEKTAVTTEKIARAAAGFVKRHPVGVLIALGAFLLIITLHSVHGIHDHHWKRVGWRGGRFHLSVRGRDMLAAEAAYYGMEADLQTSLTTMSAP
jgi:ElaB/YqjD/DUF883 family membrane-anchored ribosome-binding protein